MKNFKGFTLIELLVVISIIGVISSVIFVSFSGSRDKARLATTQNFDAQVSHALGAYAVGIWRFEEGSGTTLYDESGYGNDGTFSGNPAPTFPDGVYAGTKALQFDGTDDYVNCGSDSSLNITDAITIEAWVKTNGTPTNWDSIVQKETSWDIYGIYYNAGNFCFYINHYSDNMAFVPVTTDVWVHLVGVYDKNLGSNQIKMYKNGVEGTPDIYSASIATCADPLIIGAESNNPTTYNFNGSIDNVAIYDEALSSAQIQQHFVAGAPSHGIAIKQ